MPGPFLRFIGVAEVMGAIGLVLPWALRIGTSLTPLAAAGLIVIMVGAVAISASTMGLVPAAMPLVVGVLLTAVAYVRAGHRSATA